MKTHQGELRLAADDFQVSRCCHHIKAIHNSTTNQLRHSYQLTFPNIFFFVLQPPNPRPLNIMPDVTSDNFLSAVSFVNERAGTDLHIPDSTKLDLYALFKQATAGDCLENDKPNIFGGVVKRAKWDAWYSHKGMPRNAAKEEYVSLVCNFNAGFEPAGRVLRRRRSSVSMSSDSLRNIRSVGSLNNLSSASTSKPQQQDHQVTDYSTLDKSALIKEVELLQSEITKLSVFRVYKEGKLSRCRETMTGEDWAVRYFEIKVWRYLRLINKRPSGD